MTWMNEWEVDECVDMFMRGNGQRPNLDAATVVLTRLVRWTNENSDGWHIWPKPGRAANKLMEALNEKKRLYRSGLGVEDFTPAELNKLMAPIKAFLTRQGVDRDVIFGRVRPKPKTCPTCHQVVAS